MLKLHDKVESEFEAAAEASPHCYRDRQSSSTLFLDLLSDMVAEDPERRAMSAEVATSL
jgi:hypothetical protein